MWLSQKSTTQNTSNSSEIASTTATNNGFVSASSYSGEYRDIPIFSEFGYSAKPIENSSALVIPFEDTGACIGFLSDDYKNLLQGEILIKAPSGAFIKLCANGTVNINGTIFQQK